MNEKTKEILLITQEECAEVTQAISKIFRFGLEATHPDRTETNREHFAEELGDLLAMTDLLLKYNIVPLDQVIKAKEAKREKLKKWSNIFDN